MVIMVHFDEAMIHLMQFSFVISTLWYYIFGVLIFTR